VCVCVCVCVFFFNFVMLLEWQSFVRTFSQIWQYSIYSIKNYLSFHVAIICANFCVDFYCFFIFDDFSFPKKRNL